MEITLLFLLCIFSKIRGCDENDFILDYFVHKKASSVIGFSCDSESDNLELMKNFSQVGIRSIVTKLKSPSHVKYLVTSTYWKLGIFLDLRCYDGYRLSWIFKEASNKWLYGESHYWLVLGWELEDVTSKINDDAFTLSTDFVIAVPSILVNDTYELYDMYNPWKDGGGQINVTRLGSWSHTAKLSVTLTQSKFLRRANLHGINMRVAFFGSKYKPKNTSIEEYLQDYSTKSKDGLSKFGFIILTHLSEMFNITFHFGEVQVWQPGDTIGPLSRALIKNEIQITGSPVVMTLERLGLIKFVYPTWPFRTCFIFRNPQPKEIKINEILHPFSTRSWYMMLLFLVIFFIITALTFRYEEELSHSIYSNSFLTVLGALCQQSTSYVMDHLSTRILFLYLMIFSLLTYNYYSASIVSARLNEPIFKINDSLNELAKTKLKLASEPMIYFNFIMRRVPPRELEFFYKTKWLTIPEDDKFMYPEKAIRLVQQGGFAYHTHPDVGYPLIDRIFSFREICELMEVHVQPKIFATIAVTYNSSFVEITKIGFAKMSEVGIRNRQLIRWTSNKPRCRKEVMNISSTDIYEFAPHLIILALGMILALALLIAELVIQSYQQSRMRHRITDYTTSCTIGWC
ncbi:ionotropic receptor 75a isoform X1 [Nasonia vitripennis]|uniref:Uncharacterized protein n=1 Tax=Nasonia vitripennis TaxID=7425 RepID=A0A7M7ITL3_NASVI|nr:ionotropic receptor 75a isoform X1 [Nasonia vitripennis]